MARGGARPRSGPKRGWKVIRGGGGKGKPPADRVVIDAETRKALLKPPRSLSTRERTVWKEYAERAIDAGLLTPGTVPGLAFLCEQVALHGELREVIDQEGWQVKQPILDRKGEVVGHRVSRHPLWPQLQNVRIRTEQGLRAYGLLGDGKVKPVEDERSQPTPVNPWSRLHDGAGNPYAAFNRGDPPDEETDPPA